MMVIPPGPRNARVLALTAIHYPSRPGKSFCNSSVWQRRVKGVSPAYHCLVEILDVELRADRRYQPRRGLDRAALPGAAGFQRLHRPDTVLPGPGGPAC